MLRFVTGVFLRVAVLDFVGVDVVTVETFSVSDSESSMFWRLTAFLEYRAISSNISFVLNFFTRF